MASGALSDLLLLGRNSDPLSERGVSCDGELPAPSEPEDLVFALLGLDYDRN